MTEKGENASSPDLQIRLPLIPRQRLAQLEIRTAFDQLSNRNVLGKAVICNRPGLELSRRF
jgi:hypothetical protein